MNLCIVSPRFHPVIGGVEVYLKNIATFCSNYMKTTVITSNLISPINLFEKQHYIKKKYDLIPSNIKIIRAKTLNNFVLKFLFYFFQFSNKKLEIFLNKSKILNNCTKNKKVVENQKLLNFIEKSLIFQRDFANPNFLQIYYILKRVHKIEKINVIHSSPINLTANLFAFQFANKNHIPYICTPFFHINPFADYILYPSYQHILKKSKAIIACTSIEKKFYERYGIEEEKIFIIPPGIDVDKYEKPDIKNFRNKYKIPENVPLILFFGRRTYEKGFPQTIFALRYLITKFKDIKLMIAGPISREYLLFYKTLPLELKSHIIDLGFVDNKTKINAFASCDVFVLPSLDDAFGIVYLEAWLFKKPVIGALGGNVEGLIDDEVNGFLVPFNKVKTLAFRIEFLLKNDEIRKKIGYNGYSKLLNNYRLQLTNKATLELYQKSI